MKTFLAAALCVLCSQADAATYKLNVTDTGASYFGGTFDADDLDSDGRITTDEVTSYDAAAFWPENGFALVASSSGPLSAFSTFYIDYDLVADYLNDLIFSYTSYTPCRSLPSGEYEGETRPLTQSISMYQLAAVFGTGGYRNSLGTNPAGTCEGMMEIHGAWIEYPTVSIDLAEEPAETPLPAGLPLLASGILLMGLTGRRLRHGAR